MEYRTIGSTGIHVSVIGFGGMRLPGVSDEEAITTIRRALDHEITFFETGNGYGQGRSEELLGRALEGQRDQVVLANKAGAGSWETPEGLRATIENSIKNERAGYFDLFSFWGVNNRELFEKIQRPGIFEALEKAKADGLIRAIGFTTHAQPDEIVEFAEALPFDCVTLKYNILSQRMEKTIRALHRLNIGVVVMTPLAGGMVAQPGGEVKQRLEKEGINPAMLGLRYLTANPGVTSAISGMCHPQEVPVNAAAGSGEPLSIHEREAMMFVQNRFNLGGKFCTGCGYCLPCPHEVGIPGIFRLWNIMRGYGARGYSRGEYGKMQEGIHWADYRGKPATACVECGECEEKCPEGLPIREDLKKAHQDLTSDEEIAVEEKPKTADQEPKAEAAEETADLIAHSAEGERGGGQEEAEPEPEPEDRGPETEDEGVGTEDGERETEEGEPANEESGEDDRPEPAESEPEEGVTDPIAEGEDTAKN